MANWAAYNQALVRRGDVTVWVSSEAIAAWTPGRSGRRGGQRRYSDLAIETALTLRLLYHLPLRQAEGFLHALFGMMRLDLSAPDYTTLSRRSQPSWLLRSSATDAACLRRPSVVVVEPAQHREGHDAPTGLYAARPLPLVRDPLPDPLVRSPPVEVSHPFGEHAA